MTRVLLGVVAVLALGGPAFGQTTVDRDSVERPFAAGGRVRLDLSSGDYTVRAGAGDRVVVRWKANDQARTDDVKKLLVDVHVSGTTATIRTEGAAHHVRFTIDVPARSDIRLRVRAGDITMEGIEGHKDVRMTAGDLKIGVRPESLASAHASVTFGELDARAFGISKSGIKRSLDWIGGGTYELDARLGAGDLTLAHQW